VGSGLGRVIPARMPTSMRLPFKPSARLLREAERCPLLSIPRCKAAAGKVHRVRGLDVPAGLSPGRLSDCRAVGSVHAMRSHRLGLPGKLVDVPMVRCMPRAMGTRDPPWRRITARAVEVWTTADWALIIGVRVARLAIHKRCTLPVLVTPDRCLARREMPRYCTYPVACAPDVDQRKSPSAILMR
jgi:hypothetical protein